MAHGAQLDARNTSHSEPFPASSESGERGAIAANTRVVIASPVRLVREGLVASLRGRDGIAVIGAVNLDSEGIARIAAVAPDVVLVDLGHAEATGMTQLLKIACSEAKLVAFALAEVDDDVFACAAAGFSGYVPRESGADELYSALMDAAAGRMNCAPHITAAIFSRLSDLLRQRPARMALPSLTTREGEILALAEEGRSNKEIARHLRISSATVKNHIHHILQKLQVGRRGEAVARLRACPPTPSQIRSRCSAAGGYPTQ
jgi:two-component system, NarL family, nitrate/nitrite response regulator NarL